MKDIDALAAHQFCQQAGVAPYGKEVFAGNVHLDMFGPGARQLMHHRAAAGDDDRPAARLHQRRRDIDRAALRPAGDQIWDNLANRQRARQTKECRLSLFGLVPAHSCQTFFQFRISL